MKTRLKHGHGHLVLPAGRSQKQEGLPNPSHGSELGSRRPEASLASKKGKRFLIAIFSKPRGKRLDGGAQS